MRIAVISDLHGNSVALDHCLDEIQSSQVDQIICLGDVATLGPDPVGVVERIQSLGCINILGNHDEFMIDLKKVHEYSKVPVVVRAVEWCHQLLSPQQRAFFKTFKTEHEIKVGPQRIRFFHGSPTSHSEDITANMSPAKLDQLVGPVEGDVLVFGHTHLQMVVQHQGRYIVNPGSLGSPFKDLFFCEAPTVFKHAEYALLDVSPTGVEVTLKRTYPDLQKLMNMLDASEYPLKAFLKQQYSKTA
jgi:putative phosphoesterase